MKAQRQMNNLDKKRTGEPLRLADIMPLSFIENLDEVYHAIYQAVCLTANEIGWNILASEVNLSVGDLQQCVRDKFKSHPEVLRKIYPIIICNLKNVFEWQVTSNTCKVMLEKLEQNGVNTREDLHNVIEESVAEYEASDAAEKNDKFAEYLNNIHSLLFNE